MREADGRRRAVASDHRARARTYGREASPHEAFAPDDVAADDFDDHDVAPDEVPVDELAPEDLALDEDVRA